MKLATKIKRATACLIIYAGTVWLEIFSVAGKHPDDPFYLAVVVVHGVALATVGLIVLICWLIFSD